MGNTELVSDYISRSSIRLGWIDALYFHESYADVVLESCEVIELCFRALLMRYGINDFDIHDVSSIIEENRASLKSLTDTEVVEISKISRHLRRDRELAFYGNEDLTPSEFYRKEDAELAKSQAIDVVRIIKKSFL